MIIQVVAFVLVICSFGTNAQLNCTLNNATHNYLILDELVYDTDSETRLLLDTYNVTSVWHKYSDRWSQLILNRNNTLTIILKKLDETLFINQNLEYFYYNATLTLVCQSGEYVDMYVKIPIIDTNTFAPFFEKPLYTYNMISTKMDDFERLHYLYPIIATDNDFTNNALQFSIQANSYFDIAYNGVVGNSLNKKHYARLIPKSNIAEIKTSLQLNITVRDFGLPQRTNWTYLVINPPSPPTPNFTEAFYIGDYYSNKTVIMRSAPKLNEGVSYYQTSLRLVAELCSNFRVNVKNEHIEINTWGLSEVDFYKRNYVVCQLIATYSRRDLFGTSSGSTAIVIQMHHET